jgi:hypothetical protein
MRTNHRTMTTAGALALVAAMAISIAGCDDLGGGDTITGSGTLETTSYDFEDFSELDLGSAFDVEVTQGDSYAVEVTVDDNIVDDLDVKRDGKTVRIAMKGPDSYRNVTQEARVTMPALSRSKLSGATSATFGGFASDDRLEVELAGASSVVCSDMAAGSVKFDLAGASSVRCSDVVTGDTTVALAGASKLELTGSGAGADVKAEGASSVLMGDFPVEAAVVKLTGASNATVNASGTLDVDLAGSSDLTYLGEPRLGETKMAGDSTLERG